MPEVGTPEAVPVRKGGDKLRVRDGSDFLPWSGGEIRAQLEKFILDEKVVPAHPCEHGVRLDQRERGDQVVTRGAQASERLLRVTLTHKSREHRG